MVCRSSAPHLTMPKLMGRWSGWTRQLLEWLGNWGRMRKPIGLSTCQSCCWPTTPRARQWPDTVLTTYSSVGGPGFRWTFNSLPIETPLTPPPWCSQWPLCRRGWKKPSRLPGNSRVRKLPDNAATMTRQPEPFPYSLGMLLWSGRIGSWARERSRTDGRKEATSLWVS